MKGDVVSHAAAEDDVNAPRIFLFSWFISSSYKFGWMFSAFTGEFYIPLKHEVAKARDTLALCRNLLKEGVAHLD